jgi:hypothetical protein
VRSEEVPTGDYHGGVVLRRAKEGTRGSSFSLFDLNVLRTFLPFFIKTSLPLCFINTSSPIFSCVNTSLPIFSCAQVMRMLGAKVILTPAALRGSGMVAKAKELAVKVCA